jgi:hypothetical protein
MEDFGIIAVLVFITGLVSLIIFFVMVVAINNMNKNIKDIRDVLMDWRAITGYGVKYTCKNCKKTFIGKQPACPHCGDVKNF